MKNCQECKPIQELLNEIELSLDKKQIIEMPELKEQINKYMEKKGI